MGTTWVAHSGQETYQLVGLLTTIARPAGGALLARAAVTVAPCHGPVNTTGGADDGGDEGTRTPDPLLAKEVLSQLSYIPI